MFSRLLMPETMKLLGSSKNKVTKDKNGENFLHLEIAKVVSVYFNVLNIDYNYEFKGFVHIFF